MVRLSKDKKLVFALVKRGALNEFEVSILGNIYPVPDPQFPFLGVHYTPRMNGDIWLGPNAVLALDREGYKLTSFSLIDCLEIARFKGIYLLVLRNIKENIINYYICVLCVCIICLL